MRKQRSKSLSVRGERRRKVELGLQKSATMMENRVEAHNNSKKMKTREQARSEGAAAQMSEERDMELGGGGVAMGGAGQPGGASVCHADWACTC